MTGTPHDSGLVAVNQRPGIQPRLTPLTHTRFTFYLLMSPHITQTMLQPGRLTVISFFLILHALTVFEYLCNSLLYSLLVYLSPMKPETFAVLH